MKYTLHDTATVHVSFEIDVGSASEVLEIAGINIASRRIGKCIKLDSKHIGGVLL